MPANSTLMPGPCGLCRKTLYELAPTGPTHCKACSLAISVFWPRAEIEAEAEIDDERYRWFLLEMAHLVELYPIAYRESHGSYRWRMREIFKCFRNCEPIDIRLTKPFADATVKALDEGVHLLVALSRGRHVIPTQEKDALLVPGRKARGDVIGQKSIRPKVEPKALKKVKL